MFVLIFSINFRSNFLTFFLLLMVKKMKKKMKEEKENERRNRKIKGLFSFTCGPQPIQLEKRLHLSHSKKYGIAESQDWNCLSCKTRLKIPFHIDHIRPLSENGTNELDNLQALCEPCHGKKTLLETQKRSDRYREWKTGVSKYFVQSSVFYLKNKIVPISVKSYIIRRERKSKRW